MCPARLAATFLSAALATPVQAIAVNQIDTFTGSLQGWFKPEDPVGSPPFFPPEPIAGGGPGGAGDSFMLVTSVGTIDPDARLVVANREQWTGDYLAAGVAAIEMDLQNLGTTDLSLRLLLEDPAPGEFPTNRAVSTTPVFLPAGSGWMHVVFGVAASDLTAIMGHVDGALANTTLLRLFHNTEIAFPASGFIAAQLGVDNVRAVPVPLPPAMLLMAVGLAVLGCTRRRGESAGRGVRGGARRGPGDDGGE